MAPGFSGDQKATYSESVPFAYRLIECLVISAKRRGFPFASQALKKDTHRSEIRAGPTAKKN